MGTKRKKVNQKTSCSYFRSESPLSAPFYIALKCNREECSCSISKRSQICRDRCFSWYFGEKRDCGSWESPSQQQKDFFKHWRIVVSAGYHWLSSPAP